MVAVQKRRDVSQGGRRNWRRFHRPHGLCGLSVPITTFPPGRVIRTSSARTPAVSSVNSQTVTANVRSNTPSTNGRLWTSPTMRSPVNRVRAIAGRTVRGQYRSHGHRQLRAGPRTVQSRSRRHTREARRVTAPHRGAAGVRRCWRRSPKAGRTTCRTRRRRRPNGTVCCRRSSRSERDSLVGPQHPVGEVFECGSAGVGDVVSSSVMPRASMQVAQHTDLGAVVPAAVIMRSRW